MANPEWTEPGDWGGEIDDADKDAAICKNCGGEGCFFCDGEGHHAKAAQS